MPIKLDFFCWLGGEILTLKEIKVENLLETKNKQLLVELSFTLGFFPLSSLNYAVKTIILENYWN